MHWFFMMSIVHLAQRYSSVVSVSGFSLALHRARLCLDLLVLLSAHLFI